MECTCKVHIELHFAIRFTINSSLTMCIEKYQNAKLDLQNWIEMQMPDPRTIRRKQFEANCVVGWQLQLLQNTIAKPLSQSTPSLETHVADVVHLAYSVSRHAKCIFKPKERGNHDCILHTYSNAISNNHNGICFKTIAIQKKKFKQYYKIAAMLQLEHMQREFHRPIVIGITLLLALLLLLLLLLCYY